MRERERERERERTIVDPFQSAPRVVCKASQNLEHQYSDNHIKMYIYAWVYSYNI